MSRSRSIGLVVLFNHNYEKNISIIKSIYKPRFPKLRILMPFYYGNDEEVIGVFGNSFTFHSYIAQARKELVKMKCDDFLIIGDDLLLNPELNSDNFHDKMDIPVESFYIDKIENVSECQFNRPILEASKFFPYSTPGLDPSVNKHIPSYDDAFRILSEKGLITSTKLSKWAPFYPLFKKNFFKNFYANYKIFKARCWHFLKVLKYRLCPVYMPYPYVFGYSDIILIPANRMDELCRYLEVFATWNMFVEMAVPTAIMLLPNTKIHFANQCRYKTGNVWYPQDPYHFKKINDIIYELINISDNYTDLAIHYPKEYLYLHPVKLSNFTK